MKEYLSKAKYETKIANLTQQLSNNSQLWEQMAEVEKREIGLRYELLQTQQSLSNSEKVVEKQAETLKKSETEKLRLMNYKQ